MAIGDDLFREALQALVAGWDEFHLVGAAAGAESVCTALRGVSADILLLDLELSDNSGFALLRWLQRGDRPERPVVLTRTLQPEYVREALRLGGRGLLSHRTDSARLRSTLAAVAGGRSVFDPRACRLLTDGLPRQAISNRECQVLSLIAEGACNADIARRLGITEKTVKTVKTHVGHLLGKLQVSNRVHLALYASSTRLLDGPLISAIDE